MWVAPTNRLVDWVTKKGEKEVYLPFFGSETLQFLPLPLDISFYFLKVCSLRFLSLQMRLWLSDTTQRGDSANELPTL